jgi:hypothetical protein
LPVLREAGDRIGMEYQLDSLSPGGRKENKVLTRTELRWEFPDKL